MTSRLLPQLLLALICSSPVALGQIIYVDANLNSGADNGTSWADAHQGPNGLKSALSAAVAGDQIFAAQGTYKPAVGNGRKRSFTLKNDVEIYGSFLGTESSPAERPAFDVAPSILTGDLAGNDGGGALGDNSFHLVKGGGTNASAVLDGFIITGGNANGSPNDDRGGGILCVSGSSPTIRNCRFIQNQSTFGGGAGYINGSAPSFVDCTFENNLGGSFGGAFDIANAGTVRFDRCLFSGNSASRAGALEIFASSGVSISNSVFWLNTATGSSGGGGLWIGTGGSTTITNCAVIANDATSAKFGGLRVQGATVNVANSILWDNAGQNGGQGADNQVNSEASVSYSIVEGGFTGTGNLASDPQFVNIGAGDFRLTAGSPAVDAADRSALAADAPYDRGLAPRSADAPAVPDTGNGAAPVVDMGAFEFSIGIGDLYCSALPNSTGVSSTLTATGSIALADNDLNLTVYDLPLNRFGYFLLSDVHASVAVSNGTLCLGAPIVRFIKNVLNTGGAGSVSFTPDLTNLPQGLTFQVGETWTFQLWHRDVTGSNFSSSLGLTWE